MKQHRIYDRWCSHFFFFISSMYTPEINLSHRKKTWEDIKLIGTTIKKPGHWMSHQFHHRVTVRNCIFIYRWSLKSSKYWLTGTLDRRGQMNGTAILWRTLVYQIPLARRMKNSIPQGRMISQYCTLKSKFSKYCLKKSSIPQYREPQSPSLRMDQVLSSL